MSETPIPAPHVPLIADTTTQFLRALYGDQEGYVEICYVAGDPRTARVRRDRWVTYTPEHVDYLAIYCQKLAAAYGDVYVSRVCYSQPARRKDLAQPSRAIFIDDAPLDGDYTFTVQTSSQRYHGWILLDHAVDCTTNEALSRRAAYALAGADHGGWDITQLVRVPGSFNTKAGAHYPVHVHTARSRTFTVEELHTRLPKLPQAVAKTAYLDWDLVERIYQHRQQLLNQHGLPHRIKNPDAQLVRLLQGPVWHDTSAQRWAIAKGLIIHGYPNEELAALLIHFTNYDKSAHKGSDWLYTDIARVISKLRAIYTQIAPVPSTLVLAAAPSALPQTPRRSRGRQRKLDSGAYLAWLQDQVVANATVLMSQQDIATALHTSASTIQRLECQLRTAGKIERRVSKDRRLSFVVLLGGITNRIPIDDATNFEGPKSRIPVRNPDSSFNMEHTPLYESVHDQDSRDVCVSLTSAPPPAPEAGVAGADPVPPAPEAGVLGADPALTDLIASLSPTLRTALPRSAWPLLTRCRVLPTPTLTRVLCAQAADLPQVTALVVPVVRAFLRESGLSDAVRVGLEPAGAAPALGAPPVMSAPLPAACVEDGRAQPALPAESAHPGRGYRPSAGRWRAAVAADSRGSWRSPGLQSGAPGGGGMAADSGGIWPGVEDRGADRHGADWPGVSAIGIAGSVGATHARAHRTDNAAQHLASGVAAVGERTGVHALSAAVGGMSPPVCGARVVRRPCMRAALDAWLGEGGCAEIPPSPSVPVVRLGGVGGPHVVPEELLGGVYQPDALWHVQDCGWGSGGACASVWCLQGGGPQRRLQLGWLRSVPVDLPVCGDQAVADRRTRGASSECTFVMASGCAQQPAGDGRTGAVAVWGQPAGAAPPLRWGHVDAVAAAVATIPVVAGVILSPCSDAMTWRGAWFDAEIGCARWCAWLRDSHGGPWDGDVPASFVAYMPRYRLLLSSGRACRYFPVVAMSAWPSVSRTSVIGAPRSSAWDAWAWRNHWGETSGNPARAAAALTSRQPCEADRGPRGVPKIGVLESQVFPHWISSCQVWVLNNTVRVLPPLPWRVIWPPSA